MFSDKQRQSWQNINAPDDLLLKTREKLENGSYRHSSGLKRYSLPLIAASLFLIFVSVFLIGRGNVANVYVDGIELTEEMQVFRSEPMPYNARSVMRSSVITMSFDIKSETVIRASVGSFDVVDSDGEILYSGNEYTAEDDITVIDSFDLSVGEKRVIDIDSNYVKNFKTIYR